MKQFAILLTLLFACLNLSGQSDWEKEITPFKITGNSIAVSALQPLINEMRMSRIVGLGEGTHGTKQFNELRIAIIKELVEKNGFRIICFENAFGDSYFFNQWINSDAPLKEGMKKYLIALWQTEELESLFEWVRNFNKRHEDKVSIAGMDFNYLGNTARVILEESGKLNNSLLMLLAQHLNTHARTFDSIWNNQMKGTSNAHLVSILKQGSSYLQQIDSLVKADKLPISEVFKSALLNGISWVSGESNRDKNMANMAVNIARNNKMIIWAHAVHLALRSVFKDNSVGGCGGYIKQRIPEYYSLGTGTASGTYGGTEDQFDTKINIMHSYNLPAIKKSGWDDFFLQKDIPAFYINTHKINMSSTFQPLRLIGYGPPRSISYSDNVCLSELFDGYIFIRNTTVPEYLK